MSNRLATAVSPYLRQHADNPVDWWQWGAEAFAEARRRDVPVFLSVGYAACHWCHVMAHESFEDPVTAHLLNDGFISIKVDREERPDVDAVYMAATTALTGRGGWPMSVWLDHDGRAFYAGTYFPPAPRHSLPGFPQLLVGISAAWRDRRDEVLQAATSISSALQQHRNGVRPVAADVGVTRLAQVDWQHLCAEAVRQLASSFDPHSAGFGRAPKFPPSMVLEFLLRAHALAGPADDFGALAMAEATFEAMARGGMYDQLRGGFARYSVDDDWVVPHFEKMLYDNALLLRAYAHWWRATNNPLAERIVRETVEFLLADLRTSEGGFAASLDADAKPGDDPQALAGEGASYVWRPDELAQHLGHEDGSWVAHLCEVTSSGTFEHGSSTLQLRRDPDDTSRWRRLRNTLRTVRDARPQPARDDKVVAAWNGLVIAALADAGDIFAEPEWVAAAETAAQLLLSVHLDEDGELARVSRDGKRAEAAGVLTDYANVVDGLLALYRATGDQHWNLESRHVLTAMVSKFYQDGQWVDHVADALLPPLADPSDNAEPSGTSAACGALLSLSALGGNLDVSPVDLLDLVVDTVTSQVPLMREHPRFAGGWLGAAAALAAGPLEVAVVATSPADELRRAAVMSNSPGLVIAYAQPGTLTEVPLLAGRVHAEAPAAYVCRLGSCDLPTRNADTLRAKLGDN